MKAVLYARQSSGDEELSESVEMQLTKCRELARKEGLEIIGEFSDLNTSGRTYPKGGEAIAELDAAYKQWYAQQTKTKKYREGLGTALETIVKNDAALVIYDITRLYRPVTGSYLESYIAQRLAKVEIFSTKGKIDLGAFGDSLITTITNRINDDQLKIQKEKSILALKQMRNNGRYYGTAIWGYKYDKNTKTYVGINEELEAVKEAFRLMLAKVPIAEICRRLDKYRTGRGHLQDWSLRVLLRHPEYCGLTRNANGDLIELQAGLFNVAPISKTDWHRVQNMLGDKKTRQQRPKKYEYAYNGLVKCGYCGSALVMGISQNHRGEGWVTTYKCAGGQGRKNECQFSRIKYSVNDPAKIGAGNGIEDYNFDGLAGRGQRTLAVLPAEEPTENDVTGLFEAVMPLLASVCLTEINDSDRSEKIAERIEILKGNITKSKTAKGKIVKLIAGDLITDDEAKSQLEKLNATIKADEAELAALEAENATAGKKAIQRCYARLEQIQKGTLAPLDARELFLKRFSKIVVYDTYVVFHLLNGRKITLQKNLKRAITGMPQFTLEVKKFRDGKIKSYIRYYYNSAFVKRGRDDDEATIYNDDEMEITTIGHCESHSHHETSVKRKEWKARLNRG